MKYLILILVIQGLNAQLINGPMIGHVSDFEANIWFQCEKGSTLSFIYWNENNIDTHKVSFNVSEIKTIKLSGLQSGTNYNYKFTINEKTYQESFYKFKTPKYYTKNDSLVKIKIAFGSCVDSDGIKNEIFTKIFDQKPDLMFWLGDNVYLKNNEWESAYGFRKKYEDFRSINEAQKLFSGVSNYAIWDDHDYGPNDSDKSFIYKDLSLEMFKEYWANPGYGLNELEGIFSSFNYYDIDFFLTDNRFYRDSQKRVQEKKTILGKKQLEWLINSLVFSEAKFKLIVMGGLLLSDSYNIKNQNYISNYTEEREYLINEIVKNKIQNVIILSGDKHFSELSKFEKNDVTIYEFTSSPLTAKPNTREDLNSLRIPNSLIQENNFGLLEFDMIENKRVVIFKIYNSIGVEVFQEKLLINSNSK